MTTLCIECKADREQNEEGRTRPTDL